MTQGAKPRPRWSDPVWVRDTTYRFVNVGDGPAFDVVFSSMGDGSRHARMPSAEVPETHIDVVAPNAHVDVTFEVTAEGVPERPHGLDPHSVGWPPIAAVLTLAWNDVRRWKPKAGDEDPLSTLRHFGLERQHYSTLSLPPNQMPKNRRWPIDQTMPARQREALRDLVQYERVLNVWLSSAEQLIETVSEWETNIEKGRLLFSRDKGASAKAVGDLRRDLDGPVLTVFVSMTMLRDHSKIMLDYCDGSSSQAVRRHIEQLRRQFAFAAHVDTVRNYLAHHGLLNWITSHEYGAHSITIEVDLEPILDWASTRDRRRTDVDNVAFAEFLKRYGDMGSVRSFPLRTWLDDMLRANRGPMLEIHRAAIDAIARIG